LFAGAFEVPYKLFLTAKGSRCNLKVDKLLLFALDKGAEAMVRLSLVGPTRIKAKYRIWCDFFDPFRARLSRLREWFLRYVAQSLLKLPFWRNANFIPRTNTSQLFILSAFN
jgi:hypothetical protein